MPSLLLSRRGLRDREHLAWLTNRALQRLDHVQPRGTAERWSAGTQTGTASCVGHGDPQYAYIDGKNGVQCEDGTLVIWT
jgi:hypothetical protein